MSNEQDNHLWLVMKPVQRIDTNSGITVELHPDLYGFLPIYNSLALAKKAYPDLSGEKFIPVEEVGGV